MASWPHCTPGAPGACEGATSDGARRTMSRRPSAERRCSSTSGPVRSTATTPSGLIGKERSEEHTSELQSRGHLVCRLLLEKKKRKATRQITVTTKREQQIGS